MILLLITGIFAGFSGGLINLILWRRTIKNKKIAGINLRDGFVQTLGASILTSLSDPESKLKLIEKNILDLFDDFMANKLTVKMPVLAMFIDEKLIAEIRLIFHQEMEISLPKLLSENLNGEKAVTQIKDMLESAINKVLNRYRANSFIYLIIGAAGGGLTGYLIYLIQCNL